MRGKILFITGGLVGYVLGARAGRKRYDQIKTAADSFWNAKPVQRRVTEARDFALDAVGDVPAALFDAGKKVYVSVAANAKASAKANSKKKRASPATAPASPPDSL